jgi:hypothetical protein
VSKVKIGKFNKNLIYIGVRKEIVVVENHLSTLDFMYDRPFKSESGFNAPSATEGTMTCAPA